jgi:TIR domain/SIR2-like domain
MLPDSADSRLGEGASLWNDIVWEQLLESIGREKVIPILGPALSTVVVEGKEVTLERFVAVELAAQLDLTATDDPSLGSIVAFYLQRRRPMEELYGRINSILKHAQIQPSRALSQIAGITHFKLFVTTSFDLLLEEAINAQRFGGKALTQSLGYQLAEVVDCEISTVLKRLREPIVYHLLGKVSPFKEYVVSDDDLLEYIHTLHTGPRPEKLFDALRDNNLLLLGGNFSDWLVRLFLRLVKGRPLSFPRSALEILADERTRSDPSLVSFLGNFSLTTRVFHANAPEFIEELSTRWTARFGGEVAARQQGSGALFISYAREDATAADTLRRGLEAKGFEVWHDGQFKGAEDYDDRIQRAIKECALFIPLLSQQTERNVRDAYFRREWHLAEDRDTRNASDVRFILPLVVDGTSRNDFRTVPRRFLQKHILAAPDGGLSAEVLEAIITARDEGK